MQDFKNPMDRRRKSDGIIKLATITSIIGWILIVICTTIAIYAKPEQTNLFYEMFNIPTRDYWNYSLLYVVFVLLLFLFMISLIGILMNLMRLRRKTDKIRKSLIIQAVMSVVGIFLLWLNSVIK